MLKKVILGIVCFIVVGITGLGIYVYTLDWNKHKTLVAERFSQITGLKAFIDGNLTVELFPTPKFSAQSVKFSKNDPRKPLVAVSEISANIELVPMFSNKFILSSMSLNGANVYLDISEKGDFNWAGVGSGSKNKSGNIEVSFSDIRLANSVVTYNNKKTGDKFELPNISSNINAKSLEGPYNLRGKFIHNGSEISFNGDVVKNKDITMRLNINNAATSSKLSIDGSFGKKAKGSISFDSKSFYDIVSVVFGENKISELYDQSLLLSFVYNYENKQTKLDNFTLKYGNNIAGSGVANIKKAEKWAIDADLDMISFDLELLETIAKDVIAKTTKTDDAQDKDNNTNKYAVNLNIKSNYAKYKNADAQKLIIGAKYADNILNVDRFSIVMPGETHLKSVGKVKFDPKIEYIFNQTVDSKDARMFASVFGLDIAKYASQNNKKSIFKRLQAEMMVSGDLGAMKITVPQAVVDASEISGNLGFIFNKEKPVVLLQADVTKIIFDKYFQINNPDLKSASLNDKIIYQLGMAPWKGKFEADVSAKIGNAVFNNVVIDNLDLQFVADNETLDVKKFHSTSLGGAEVDIKFNADNVYTKPYFNELTYSVKTNNFPVFAKSLSINTGDKELFKRKLFAAQGAMSGDLSKYSLSSIQKFGDVEFSYTGDVSLTDKNKKNVKGNVELKANNFSGFVKAIGLNYSPDIPVTTLTLMGTIEGNYDNFAVNDLSAYLGTNHITGKFSLDNQTKPTLVADVNFDKFDVNRMFNIKKTQTDNDKAGKADFIAKPSFESEKFDLSSLSKANFDIKTNIKHLVLDGENYNNADIVGTLKDGVLDVSKFETAREDSKIVFDAKINSNNIPKIEGNFNVSGIKVRNIGGNVYSIENSVIDIEGNFNSLLQSKKEFFDNLNSKGRFKVYGTTVSGWDLDIIKFELEQRKSLTGFNEAILNSLKTGKSNFDEIGGRYEIAKGIVIADNVSWNSPVITMNMGLELNLSDWKFNSTFNAFYKNASFSDVLKFSLSGDIDNPKVQSDLSESMERIASIEENVEKVRADKEKEKNANIKKKSNMLINNIKLAQQNIKRMSLDVARYKPVTKNVDVVKVYENNIKDLKEAEIKLKELEKKIVATDDEKVLMDLEATLAKETARFNFIPKLLEENYIVDSKYVFDDVFNKITWLFNLAQNNSSYYNSLTDVYMDQIELLNSTDTPVDSKVVDSIKNDMNTIAMDVEKISKLHSKIRDNYLDIIDTTSIARMKENNGIAEQALSTMLVYVKQLNNSLINSIDVFRAALDINAKDYDLYMVYPPEKVADIDVSKPTTKNGEKTESKISSSEDISSNDADSAKKKDNLAFSVENFSKGISSLMDKLNNRKKTETMSDMEFNGLSNAIKIAQSNKTKKEEELKLAELKVEKPVIEKTEVIEEKTEDIKQEAKSENIKNESKQTKEEAKEIVVAEAKPLELPILDVKVSDVLDAIEPIEEENIDKVKNETKTIASNLIDKTKTLISDFVAKFTPKKEENKPFEVALVGDNDLAKIEVKKEVVKENTESDDINPVEEPKETEEVIEDKLIENKAHVSNLKVNPVIAMNIGDSNNDLKDVKIPNIIEKKKGFEKKNKAQEVQIASVDNASKELKDENKEQAKGNDISKGELLGMFVMAENIVPQHIETITEVDEFIENDEDFSLSDNKYVSKTNRKVQYFNGNIGKSFSSREIKDNVIMRNKKHLFKSKYKKLAKLDGNIGKKFALSVK